MKTISGRAHTTKLFRPIGYISVVYDTPLSTYDVIASPSLALLKVSKERSW